jgi:PAS domain S-box-containing protein
MDQQTATESDTSRQMSEQVEQLTARLAELRARLKEPEEIIRAIRYGEVDAIVVVEPPGEKVYSLRSADALYRVIVEDMREGAVVLDAAGVIVYCNWQFAALMKVKRESIVGTRLQPFIPDRSRPFFDYLRQQSANGTSRREMTFRAADGAAVPVYVAVNRIALEDQEVFCVIVTDLTEQKRQEELVTVARRKDEFLAVLAHELRNPLAPITNAVELLRRGDAGEAAWATDVIDRQAQHLRRLVDDLLDISRISRGTISLHLEPVDLAAVVAQAVEASRPAIDARKHQLTTSLPPGPLRVRGDLTRLSQVLGNLLNNAAKFTPEGGQIWLTVEQQNDEAVVRVRDTGIGIPAGMLSYVFDLFTQVDTGSERRRDGLGIGLALVRNLTEMHGGSVAVRSDGLGKGSEFIVKLPLLAAAPPTGRPHAAGDGAAAPPGPSHRVLVVDDNRDVAESQAKVLARWGHQVRVAADGRTAVDVARAFQPELILLDIGLPGMNGYEVARELRQLPGLEHPILVAVTGFGQDDDRHRSLAAGFDHHWVKPGNQDALRELLASLAPPRE